MLDMMRCIRKICGKDIQKLISSIILTAIDTILSMAMLGMVLMTLVSLAAGSFDKKFLIQFTTVLIITFILRCVIYSIAYVSSQIKGSEIITDFRISFGDHIRSLCLGYFDKNGIGTLNSVLTTDISDVETILTHSLCDFVKVIVYTVFALVYSLIVSPSFSIILVALVIVALPLLNLGGKVAAKHSERVHRATRDVIARVVEYVNGIQTFRLYHLTGKKFKRLEKSFSDMKRESINLELGLMPYNISFSIIVSLFIPISLVVGCLLFKNGKMEMSTYIIIILMSTAISGIMGTLASLYTGMKFLNKASANIISVLDEKPLPYRTSKPHFDNYGITLDNVFFQYTDNVPVLKNVSFKSPAGTTTALIGPSGSGKSTIASLISRFWDTTQGEIRIGNQNIKDIDPDALTENISVVFQDVYLLNDTVYNNIRLGKADASCEEIVEAAKAANCHNFIMKMEKGYDTVIGEGGSTLSGGEKQRISIARALVKDAPIVLLDESTSSLDADNEAEINEGLDILMKNKTVIVIAHRLNTITQADNIIVLDHGVIREAGNHEALLKQDGWYAHIYAEQQRAKKWNV